MYDFYLYIKYYEFIFYLLLLTTKFTTATLNVHKINCVHVY